ncbi:MAG: sigma-70 family RNA polymerase sigma factor [Bryobacteraceae bacterium]
MAIHLRCRDLVERVRDNETGALAELYDVFAKGIRFYLWRQLGIQELDDHVHDAFLIVVDAIRTGELREPERLMGFIRTVVRRMVAGQIDRAVQERREQCDLEIGYSVIDPSVNPEEAAMTEQRALLMEEILMGIEPRDREILTRFYVREQSHNQICEEMGLSETQFRLLKSRAKARFGELGRRKLKKMSFARFLMRSSAR